MSRSAGNREEVGGGFGLTVDIRGLEGFDGVRWALLPGSHLGDANHPGGVVIAERIVSLEVVCGEFQLRGIGLAEAGFDVGASGVKVDTIFADIDCERPADVPWSRVTALLAINCLCAPGSELAIEQRWYASTALDDLLEIEEGKINVCVWPSTRLTVSGAEG